MISLSPHLRFFLYREPTDMRKSFDGLSGLVTRKLGRDPLSGDVYIFINRRRNQMKLLIWDRSGFWLFYKRLEKGVFELPKNTQAQASIALSYEMLVLILEGIDLSSVKRRERYTRPDAAQACQYGL